MVAEPYLWAPCPLNTIEIRFRVLMQLVRACKRVIWRCCVTVAEGTVIKNSISIVLPQINNPFSKW